MPNTFNKKNKYLSYAVVILGIAVLGIWYDASIKENSDNQWEYLS